MIKKFVILSDGEGSSSISMAAVQGEEDQHDKRQMSYILQKPLLLPTQHDKRPNVISPSGASAFTYLA